jgi:hypothetical protein
LVLLRIEESQPHCVSLLSVRGQTEANPSLLPRRNRNNGLGCPRLFQFQPDNGVHWVNRSRWDRNLEILPGLIELKLGAMQQRSPCHPDRYTWQAQHEVARRL